MMRRLLFTLVVLAGCTKASAEKDAPVKAPAQTAPVPAIAPNFAKPPPPAPAPPAKPVAPKVQVELTAVTLADDCGGTAPYTAPTPAPETTIKAKAKSAQKGDIAGGAGRASRRCEQTSMQLAVTASDVSRINVKSVELFDDAGKSLGKLTASKPTRWSADKAMYETWNEMTPAGTLVNISYVLQQPNWTRIGNRWNRMYTLKTVLTVGGVDRAAQKDVSLSAPTSLPPNVKT